MAVSLVLQIRSGPPIRRGPARIWTDFAEHPTTVGCFVHPLTRETPHGLADRPERLDRTAHAHAARDRSRRRQHHLHLDPRRKAPRRAARPSSPSGAVRRLLLAPAAPPQYRLG